jgi:hypothetical protein
MGFMGSVAGGFAGLVEEGEVVIGAEDFEFYQARISRRFRRHPYTTASSNNGQENVKNLIH